LITVPVQQSTHQTPRQGPACSGYESLVVDDILALTKHRGP